MESTLEILGLIAIVVICVSSLIIAWAAIYKSIHESCYRGIRRQISDTVAKVELNFKDSDKITVRDLRFILHDLNARHTPNIEELEAYWINK